MPRSPAWRLGALLSLVLLVRTADAVAGGLVAGQVAASGAGRTCHDAAADAERAWGLPGGLLDAIGHVESGRYDAAAGRVDAWPWAINAAGQGRYAASAAEAIAAVQALRSQGVQSIDVGCFQMNLFYHPDAFASLAQAFDPDANAQAAAAFLSSLYARSGGWDTAVALYHSAVPERGEPYQRMVAADWHGERVAFGWHPAGGVAPRSPPADPFVIMISARAAAVAVYTPSSPPVSRASGPGGAGRLPRVFTPAGPG
ncbi:MAG: murein transglycosylase [Acidisphaera sp.]|nr:murein transglycosylase [Acidisphaera sp.]